MPEAGLDLSVMNVLPTLDLLGHVTPASLVLLETTVTHALEGGSALIVIPALPTLDPLDNVTPAWRDLLDHTVSTVKDLDSAPRVTALNVSRTVSGLEQFMKKSKRLADFHWRNLLHSGTR